VTVAIWGVVIESLLVPWLAVVFRGERLLTETTIVSVAGQATAPSPIVLNMSGAPSAPPVGAMYTPAIRVALARHVAAAEGVRLPSSQVDRLSAPVIHVVMRVPGMPLSASETPEVSIGQFRRRSNEGAPEDGAFFAKERLTSPIRLLRGEEAAAEIGRVPFEGPIVVGVFPLTGLDRYVNEFCVYREGRDEAGGRVFGYTCGFTRLAKTP
jgi:hypothetical protein